MCTLFYMTGPHSPLDKLNLSYQIDFFVAITLQFIHLADDINIVSQLTKMEV